MDVDLNASKAIRITGPTNIPTAPYSLNIGTIHHIISLKLLF